MSNRAGGIFINNGELERNNLINSTVRRIDYPTLRDAISDWDILSGETLPVAFDFSEAPLRWKKAL